MKNWEKAGAMNLKDDALSFQEEKQHIWILYFRFWEEKKKKGKPKQPAQTSIIHKYSEHCLLLK